MWGSRRRPETGRHPGPVQASITRRRVPEHRAALPRHAARSSARTQEDPWGFPRYIRHSSRTTEPQVTTPQVPDRNRTPHDPGRSNDTVGKTRIRPAEPRDHSPDPQRNPRTHTGRWGAGSAIVGHREQCPRGLGPSPSEGPSASQALQEALTPPPTHAPRAWQHEVRAEGDSPAVELGIEPADEPAKVLSSPAGKPQQHVLQAVSRRQGITALAGHHRVRQHTPRLIQIRPALGQGSSHSPRPQQALFQLPDRYASRRRHTTDPANRNNSSGPPPLCAQPLRTPTRHRPFGSACRHPATDGPTLARDQREPEPLQVLLLLNNIRALSGRRVMPGPADKCSRLRPTQPGGPPPRPGRPRGRGGRDTARVNRRRLGNGPTTTPTADPTPQDETGRLTAAARATDTTGTEPEPSPRRRLGPGTRTDTPPRPGHAHGT
ncbi:hypothetical protein ABIA38_009021 [Embleya sp. AB8]